MNSLNKIKKIFMCTSLFTLCLLLNVSTAEIVADVKYSSATTSGYTTTSELFGYTGLDIHKLMYRYIKYPSDYANDFNTLITSASSNGYNYFIFNSDSITSKYYAFIPKGMDVAFYQYDSSGTRFNLCVESSSELPVYFGTFNITNSVPSSNGLKQYPFSDLEHGLYIDSNYYITNTTSTPFLTNTNVKLLNASLIWDGETYLYKAPVDNPDSPTMPTNAEIAQAVQAFYNSDFYKNNKEFSDFLVLYNTNNGYFDFVGHTLGNILGQVIIPPNYRFEGKMYSSQWWEFFIDENSGPSPYGTSYYLYSSNDLGENIIYNGIGKISELLDLSFGTNSVIVYSTTDYPVRTYVLDESTGDYTYTEGVIEGDQYTYDENLDPTENGYNPLDNFVTVDPSQTIVNNADFSNISDAFEQFKDLFSFNENMQWLVIANNKLSNYFLGFLVMCCLFITLGRILRG